MSFTTHQILLDILVGVIGILCLITFGLYAIQFKIIVNNKKKYDSSYFKLFRYAMFLNIYTVVNTFFLLQLPSVAGQFEILTAFYLSFDQSLLSKIIYTSGYALAYLQYYALGIFGYNRVGSIFLIPSYISKKIYWGMSVASFLYGALDTIYQSISGDISILLVQETGFIVFASTRNLGDYFMFLFPFMSANQMFVYFAYALMYRKCRRECITNVSRVKRNLAKCVFALSIAEFMGLCVTGFRIYWVGHPFEAILTSVILPIVSNFISLIHPWLLVFTCREIKEDLLKMPVFKKFSKRKERIVPASVMFVQV